MPGARRGWLVSRVPGPRPSPSAITPRQGRTDASSSTAPDRSPGPAVARRWPRPGRLVGQPERSVPEPGDQCGRGKYDCRPTRSIALPRSKAAGRSRRWAGAALALDDRCRRPGAVPRSRRGRRLGAVSACERGVRFMDVGCMQVDWQLHPSAFEVARSGVRSWPPMSIMPRAYLRSLYAESDGDWNVAVGWYHSHTVDLAGITGIGSPRWAPGF